MDRVNYEQRVLDSLDKLEEDVTEIKVDIAAMPARYVTKKEAKIEAAKLVATRRWLVSTIVAVAALAVAALNTL